MNIKVLGWYNHGNTGDEAYKLTFPMLFPGRQIEFVEEIAPNDPTDVLILGGGDVVYPSFTQYFANAPNAAKFVASVSLTESSDFASIRKYCNGCYVRDYSSALLANQNGVSPIYAPDLAFMLTPDRQAGQAMLQSMFQKQKKELYEKVVVVVVSNYLAYSGLDFLARDFTTFIKMSQDLAEVADNVNASFVFLPFSVRDPHDDRMTNSWVSDRAKYYEKNLVVWDELSVQDTLNIVAAADAVVSSRLHSTIFATLSGVPFIDLTHHTKNIGFIQTLDKNSWSIPFWEFSIRGFKDLLNQLLSGTVPDASLIKFTKTSKEQLNNAVIL